MADMKGALMNGKLLGLNCSYSSPLKRLADGFSSQLGLEFSQIKEEGE